MNEYRVYSLFVSNPVDILQHIVLFVCHMLTSVDSDEQRTALYSQNRTLLHQNKLQYITICQEVVKRHIFIERL